MPLGGMQDEYPALSSCVLSLFCTDYFTEKREHKAHLTFIESELPQNEAGDLKSDVPQALR